MDRYSSTAWHRIRQTCPRLSARARVSRQVFRSQPWYVVHDRVSGKFHRCPPVLHEALALMDGTRSIEQIWHALLLQHGDGAITQEDMLRFVADLGRADLLAASERADLVEQERRRRASLWSQVRQFVGNPVALRIPLLNPDRLLSRLASLCSPLPGRLVFAIWLIVVGLGLAVTGYNWTAIGQNFVDQAFQWNNLLLVWGVFPLVKVLHELGHGLATRVRGGEVHEAGLMLLLFVPIPYIECSSASALPDKRDRIVVGAAGMAVDLWIGALALIGWTLLEPGLLRSLMFNVMLVSWASTLVFNGNPLLRYDGYYVLSDLLEIPNLAQRANSLYGYLFLRFVAGVPDTAPPHDTVGEQRWMLAYGLLSFLYRMGIALTIALVLVGEFRPFGLVLALWVLSLMVGVPLIKTLHQLLYGPRLVHHRLRAVLVSALALSGLGLVLFAVPVTHSTVVIGQVIPSDTAILRAAEEGFVAELALLPDAPVAAGQLVVRLENAELGSRDQELKAQLDLAQVRTRSTLLHGDAEAVGAREQHAQLLQESGQASLQVARLQVRAQQDGVLRLHLGEGLIGRHLARGEEIGYVLGDGDRIVKVLLQQHDYDKLGAGVERAEAWWPGLPRSRLTLQLLRFSAGATEELPAAAHAREGGGDIPTDPKDNRHLTALRRVFQVDLSFAEPAATRLPSIGSRVHVKLQHRSQTLAQMAGDWLRQRLIEL